MKRFYVDSVLYQFDANLISLGDAKEEIFQCWQRFGDSSAVLQPMKHRCGCCLRKVPADQLVTAKQNPDHNNAEEDLVAKITYSEAILGGAICKECLEKILWKNSKQDLEESYEICT